MLEAALEWIRTRCSQPSAFVNGCHFLNRDGKWDEIEAPDQIIRAYRDENNRPLALGTIESLIDFINNNDADSCHIVVGRERCTAYFGVEDMVSSHLHKDTALSVHVPFKQQPRIVECDYVKFLDFLDQHGENIHEFGVLTSAVREMKATDSSELKVRENGPVILLEASKSKGIEGSSLKIPKEITIDMQTGTREFLISNVYLLRITQKDGFVFTLTKKELDGSWEKLRELATEKLKAGLPEGTLILEGA